MPGFCREPGTSAIDACIGLKLLLDQNLSFRLLDKLEAAYLSSAHVKFVGLDQADDLTVWQFAKDNGFTIVTKDSDGVRRRNFYATIGRIRQSELRSSRPCSLISE